MRMSDPLLEHLQKHVGPITTVFEELVPGEPKLDLVHVGSSFFRRYELVVTRGMSAQPMDTPVGCTEPRFAEILALLPKGWPVRKSAFGAEANYWPLRMIKTLAQHPFHAKTWLGFGHTHANGASESTVKPYAQNTNLCAVITLPSLTLGERAWSYKREDGELVALWAAVPLHLSELKFKQANGVDALLDLLSRNKITDLIDPARRAVVK
jgi:Suppressor of fused protein (SUFU)